MKLPRIIALPGNSPRSIQGLAEQATKVLSGGVSYGSAPVTFSGTQSNQDPSNNMDCWKTGFAAPGVANTEFAVPHNLQRVPIGYIVIGRTDPGILYDNYPGTTAWTKATPSAMGNIYLKCTNAGTQFKIIII